jgi:hypothetical protein
MHYVLLRDRVVSHFDADGHIIAFKIKNWSRHTRFDLQRTLVHSAFDPTTMPSGKPTSKPSRISAPTSIPTTVPKSMMAPISTSGSSSVPKTWEW